MYRRNAARSSTKIWRRPMYVLSMTTLGTFNNALPQIAAGGRDTVMSVVTPASLTSNPSRQFSFQPPQPRSGHSQACLSSAAIQRASDRTSVISTITPAIMPLTSNARQFLSQPPDTAIQQQMVSYPVATTWPALHTGNHQDNLAARKSNTPASQSVRT
jgi:hypothetical protein